MINIEKKCDLMYSKIIRIIENGFRIHVFSDKQFIQAEYFATFRKRINWLAPRTFNEKIQWLKINDRKPIYEKLVDKYEVKAYIENKIGSKYVIPTYGVWKKYEDIDFGELPNSFVLKCTHDSGSVFVCKNKDALNEDECKKTIKDSLSRNFYYVGREWPYKNIRPRVLAEAYLLDTAIEDDLSDYKIHCFNGEPKFILVCKDRFSENGFQETFFDLNWNVLDVKRPNRQLCNPVPEKPKLLDEMIEISKELSKEIPFVRIDLYETGNHLYFGEMTFYPASGFVQFEPEEYDDIFGRWLNIDSVVSKL